MLPASQVSVLILLYYDCDNFQSVIGCGEFVSSGKIENSWLKCRSTFTVMFISITDLHIPDYDESTYFSVANIDSMQQPGETMKFDGNGDFETEQWIQQRASRNTTELHYTIVVS